MLEVIKYVSLFSAIALFLVAGFGVIWQPRMCLAAIPAFLLIMSANLDRVESFKASYQSAVELTQTIDDAKEAIRQIQELAVVTGETLIDLKLNSHALVVKDVDIAKEEDDFKATVIASLKKM